MALEQITRADAQALIPAEQYGEIFDGIVRESAMLKLMRRLPNMARGTMNLPVLSALPSVKILGGDAAQKPTTKTGWENKVITAGEIATIVPVPDAVLQDSAYDLFAYLKPLVAQAFGAKIDAAVLFGTEKIAAWPDGIVPGAVGNGKVVVSGTNADLVEDINQVMSLVEVSGYDVNGFASAIQAKASLRGLRDANGGLLFQPSLTAGTPGTLFAQPIEYLRNSAWDLEQALMLCGDFQQAVYSIRQELTIDKTNSGVITDGNGAVALSAYEQDCTLFRFVMRFGWQLPNPINISDTSATRYPFAALQQAVPSGGGGE
ncbi:MAG: phage major capsid protein [Oscillospiraceae bacterium]|jgi:HK97 family phage major capsid protein|nr:phage major capsid protein [Oscillospiraceae bacterium]